MPHIIKLTHQQIRESLGNAFEYIDGNNDIPQYNGQSQIAVTGKVKDDEYGTPKDSTEIAQSICPQTMYRYPRHRSAILGESDDENNDGVDDFYNHKDMDILSNGTDNDNLTRIPATIEKRVDMLINDINTANLTSRQQAIVLNKVIESMSLKDLPFSWKKELRMKINAH